MSWNKVSKVLQLKRMLKHCGSRGFSTNSHTAEVSVLLSPDLAAAPNGIFTLLSNQLFVCKEHYICGHSVSAMWCLQRAVYETNKRHVNSMCLHYNSTRYPTARASTVIISRFGWKTVTQLPYSLELALVTRVRMAQ